MYPRSYPECWANFGLARSPLLVVGGSLLDSPSRPQGGTSPGRPLGRGLVRGPSVADVGGPWACRWFYWARGPFRALCPGRSAGPDPGLGVSGRWNPPGRPGQAGQAQLPARTQSAIPRFCVAPRAGRDLGPVAQFWPYSLWAGGLLGIHRPCVRGVCLALVCLPRPARLGRPARANPAISSFRVAPRAGRMLGPVARLCSPSPWAVRCALPALGVSGLASVRLSPGSVRPGWPRALVSVGGRALPAFECPSARGSAVTAPALAPGLRKKRSRLTHPQGWMTAAPPDYGWHTARPGE